MGRLHTLYPQAEAGRKKGGPSARREVPKDVQAALRLGSNRVVVVGLVGKSFHGKANTINILGDSPLAQLFDFESTSFHSVQESLGHCRIEMYHCAEQDVVYLNLVSLHDAAVFINMIQNLEKNMPYSDFHLLLEKKEYHHLKAMLFMFHVCHIILVENMGVVLDLHVVRMLRVLAAMKHMVAPAVTAHLSHSHSHDHPKQSSPYAPGYTTPFLSFLFHYPAMPKVLREQSILNADEVSSLSPVSSKSSAPSSKVGNAGATGSVGETGQDVVRHWSESQIRFLLRKCRLLPSDGSHSSPQPTQLFGVDGGRFVHVVGGSTESTVSHALASLLSANNLQSPLLQTGMEEVRDFILQQAKVIREQAANKRVELPTSKNFYLSCLALQQVFLFTKRGVGRVRGDMVEKLKTFLDPEYKFSQSRCVQALPGAREAYLRDLPPYYTSHIHEKQLDKALRVFFEGARGPAAEAFVTRLTDDCTKIWQNGRRLCDDLSLTGRPCIHRIHALPDDLQSQKRHSLAQDSHTESKQRQLKASVQRQNGILPAASHYDDYDEEDEDFDGESYYDEDEEDDYDEDEEEYYEKDDNEQAIMPHSSGFRSLHACNCGRSRQTRDDPFDLRQANYEFYIMPCCAQCPRLALPAAIGSGSDAYFPSWSLVRLGGASLYRRDLGITFEGFMAGYNNLSLLHVPCHYYAIPTSGCAPHPLSHPTLSSRHSPRPSPVQGADLTLQATGGDMVATGLNLGAALNVALLHRRFRFGESKLHAYHVACPHPSHAQPPATSAPSISGQSTHSLSPPSTAGTSAGPPRSPSRLSSKQKRDRQRRKDRDDHYLQPPPQTHDAEKESRTDPLLLPSQWGVGVGAGGRPVAAFVAVLIGFEYECCFGHRFLATGHSGGSHSKAGSKHLVRDHQRNFNRRTGEQQRVRLNSDIPLFVPCIGPACHQKSPAILAQLQRIYVITPDQPEAILLNPRVQWVRKCGDGARFSFGLRHEVCLPPNSFLCLRLPYVYVHDGKPLLETTFNEPYTCTLARDLLGVSVPQPYT